MTTDLEMGGSSPTRDNKAQGLVHGDMESSPTRDTTKGGWWSRKKVCVAIGLAVLGAGAVSLLGYRSARRLCPALIKENVKADELQRKRGQCGFRCGWKSYFDSCACGVFQCRWSAGDCKNDRGKVKNGRCHGFSCNRGRESPGDTCSCNTNPQECNMFEIGVGGFGLEWSLWRCIGDVFGTLWYGPCCYPIAGQCCGCGGRSLFAVTERGFRDVNLICVKWGTTKYILKTRSETHGDNIMFTVTPLAPLSDFRKDLKAQLEDRFIMDIDELDLYYLEIAKEYISEEQQKGYISEERLRGALPEEGITEINGVFTVKGKFEVLEKVEVLLNEREVQFEKKCTVGIESDIKKLLEQFHPRDVKKEKLLQDSYKLYSRMPESKKQKLQREIKELETTIAVLQHPFEEKYGRPLELMKMMRVEFTFSFDKKDVAKCEKVVQEMKERHTCYDCGYHNGKNTSFHFQVIDKDMKEMEEKFYNILREVFWNVYLFQPGKDTVMRNALGNAPIGSINEMPKAKFQNCETSRKRCCLLDGNETMLCFSGNTIVVRP